MWAFKTREISHSLKSHKDLATPGLHSWTEAVDWRHLPILAALKFDMVPSTPQGTASAAVCHGSSHLTWHLLAEELVTSALESSSIFKVQPSPSWRSVPHLYLQCFCSPNPFVPISNSYWTSPEKNLLVDPWMNCLLNHPPKQKWWKTPMTWPAPSAQGPCLSANFPCNTLNSKWPGTQLFTSEAAEFLNLSFTIFGSDTSPLLGAVLCIADVYQHPWVLLTRCW